MSLEASDHLGAQDVMVRYAACIDDRDWQAYRECFMDDVELSGFGPDPIRGPDAWIAFVQRAIEPFTATQHLLGPPRVDLRGNEAALRTELQAQHFYASPKGRILTLWGAYRTLAVRDGELWRIRELTLQTRSTRTTDAEPV